MSIAPPTAAPSSLGASSGVQSPTSVAMIRPHHFSPNPETLPDNTFQAEPTIPADRVAERAYAEVTAMAETLRREGVEVQLFDDSTGLTPDSVFPNNWLSTHGGGDLVLYPMAVANRRRERRTDILAALRHQYRVSSIVDYSVLEDDDYYLEGTGVMVLDRVQRIAYVCRSHRVSPPALARFCDDFRYRPVVFDALDRTGRPIYHTNVMMSVGTQLALVGFDTMPQIADRHAVHDSLRASGHEIVALTREQIENFAGNAFEVVGRDGPRTVMSRRALSSLRPDQRAAIEGLAPIVAVDVPTIELAGGSARCMIVGIHLETRTSPTATPTPSVVAVGTDSQED